LSGGGGGQVGVGRDIADLLTIEEDDDTCQGAGVGGEKGNGFSGGDLG
jgi:hypothetical protein